jgi:hypothetical protein
MVAPYLMMFCHSAHLPNLLVLQPGKYVFFSFIPPEEGQKDTSVPDFADILPIE